MGSCFRLLAVKSVREWARGLRGPSLVLLLVGVAAAFVTQWLGVSAEPSARALDPTGGKLLGWLLLVTLVLAAVTGPYSTRLPHGLADVAWLYASPIGIRSIVAATIAWRSVLRGAVWVAVAAVLDGSAVLGGGRPVALASALGALPTIVALTAWSAAASSTRGHPVWSRVCVALGAGVALVLWGPPIVGVIVGRDPTTALDRGPASAGAEALGGTLLGAHGPLSVALVVGILLAAALLTRHAGGHLRERITIDASFWSELSPVMLARPEGSAEKEPWRRGTALVGAAALLWFELAVLRRANFHRSVQLPVVVGALVIGALDPNLVLVFPLWSAVAFVVGASLGGIALHLRLQTVLLTPGSLVARVAAAELPHLLLAWFGLALAVLAGGLTAGFGPGRMLLLMVDGTVLLLVATGVRLLASALTYGDDLSMPLGRFHLNLVLVSGLGVGLVVGLSLLGSFLIGSSTASVAAPTVAAVPLAVAALWRLARRSPPGRQALRRSLRTRGSANH